MNTAGYNTENPTQFAHFALLRYKEKMELNCILKKSMLFI